MNNESKEPLARLRSDAGIHEEAARIKKVLRIVEVAVALLRLAQDTDPEIDTAVRVLLRELEG